ncbi:MAG: cysteine desulfurase [Bacteroidaceae bacterium]|nr:cysteine desulfurase [Bacteroidaceae bacterium]MBQ5706160.1 cysteine desulfurase [Bacteroidaceae bacterium]MBQ5817378.1 cysteine desulfurase [Bacteroidaceae bacterium]
MFDPNNIREQFPILQREVYGKKLIYLDNAATTQKPLSVIEAITEAYTNVNANVHRGVHFLSQKATEQYEDARETVRAFINARHRHEIIFTRGTTESINLVAASFGDSFLNAGDEVIVSTMEHHSNIVPWQLLVERLGIKLRVIPLTADARLDKEAYRALFNEKTRFVSITHTSNVMGVTNPVKEFIDIAHEHNVPVLIDGAQSVPHKKVDVQELDADFFVFSGHKIYGPTGIGVLYGKEEILNRMKPYQGGGEMIQTVRFEKTTFNELPYKFEAGTPDYVGAIALAKALDFVSSIGIDVIAAHEQQLTRYALEQLKQIPGMRIFGEPDGAAISFLVGDIHPADLGTLLDRLGIAIRTGHHCAQPLIDHFGIPGTVRASFAIYNTREEVDALIAGINRVAKMFG